MVKITVACLFTALLHFALSVKKPHIVLMLADDMGWGDTPWHDAPTLAPNLLDLAQRGIRLERYYVQPICTPTRGALMTGKYPSRLGLQHGVIGPDTPYGLPLNETILPAYMKKLGYAVHGVGKWHLGHCSWGHTPVRRGFDSFYGYYNGATDYYTKMMNSITYNGFDFRQDRLNSSGYLEDEILWSANTTYSSYLYTQRAKQIIARHDPSQPLFLYLPMQNPHFPAEVPAEYYNRYEGVVKDETRRTLLAMISALDDTVGAVVNTLKDAHMWENTVFVFFSDNGGMLGVFSIGQINYPLRGGKATYWEGGIRSNAFVHSPLLRGGVINNQLMHVTDWLPTLMHVGACGTAPSNCTAPDIPDIDGVNQWSAITGETASLRSEFLINVDQSANNAALRMGRWKLMQGFPGPGPWVPPPEVNQREFTRSRTGKDTSWRPRKMHWQSRTDQRIRLYDVESDPYEKQEVSKENPDVVSKMLERLEKHKKAAVPPGNKDSDPRANPDLFNGVWTPWLDSC